MAHFYAMSFRDVMEMPLRSFWSFNRNISRIQAENDMRAITVAGAVQSGETYTSTNDRLAKEHGTPLRTIDNRRTPSATAELRNALLSG